MRLNRSPTLLGWTNLPPPPPAATVGPLPVAVAVAVLLDVPLLLLLPCKPPPELSDCPMKYSAAPYVPAKAARPATLEARVLDAASSSVDDDEVLLLLAVARMSF